ncbi:MAG: cell division protein FtsQ/DivIB [Steroidobacteraceae bacterium]
MDGGGRLAQPLTRSGPSDAEEAAMPADAEPRPPATLSSHSRRGRAAWLRGYASLLQRWALLVAQRRPRQGAGIAASAALLIAALAYGVVKGGHVIDVIDELKDTRDAIANTAGFRIAAISLSGQKEVSREEVLTTTGVTGRSSLLFLDVDAARDRLKTNPWIADATVLKLYPDHLQITITERQPFALWQKDGRISVIASDGTVLEPFVARRYFGLPLVVGRSAQVQAKDFLAILDKYRDIRPAVRASILVAERRWNLRLKNGIDVRLPELDVEKALDALVGLDHDKKLLSRDIVAVDLRLPDRVTVRLSDSAAQAREEASKDKKKKKAGSA